MIPFNKPHGFRILNIDSHSVRTFIPYRKSNFNHLKGLHATALATLSEFTTGFLLINILGMRNYRIILQRLNIEYHYQGKTNATASFEVTDQWLQEQVYTPLEQADAVVVSCPVKIHDALGNLLTSAEIYWQLKRWSKVRTKV